jgi:hypothetical protein
VSERKPKEGAGQEDADANATGASDFHPEDKKLQQQDITGENEYQGVGRATCSGTTPGVIPEDSGRTPDEEKLREVTLGRNFFIGGKSAELNPFSTVSQAINNF